MFLNVNKLSNANNDKDFYRLFFIILCFLNLAFHFLYLSYAPASYDPPMLRVFSSVLCLAAIVVSFWEEMHFYRITAYLALLVFLGINNCYFLGANNYA